MINEEKKRIVIGNYFDVDCDVDTTIREAYELGFDRGIQKATPVVRRDVLKQVLETIDGYVGRREEKIDGYEEREAYYLSTEERTKMNAALIIRALVEELKGGEQE